MDTDKKAEWKTRAHIRLVNKMDWFSLCTQTETETKGQIEWQKTEDSMWSGLLNQVCSVVQLLQWQGYQQKWQTEL
jgi:hypothetical protein